MKKIFLIFITLLILVPTLAFGDTITITNFVSLRIFQRDIGGTSTSVPISGTYSGSPTSIEARIVQYNTSTEIVTWTTIVASPSGNTFSGSLTVPQGTGNIYYTAQVRYGNNHSVVSNGSNPWGVGILVGIIGQSNSTQGWSTGSLGGGTDSGSSTYGVKTTNGTSWSGISNANAAVAFADTLGTYYNVPIGLIMKGVGGSSISTDTNCASFGYWLNTNSTWWPAYQTAVNNFGGIVEGTMWSQGEAEGSYCPTSIYGTYLASLFAQIRSGTNSPKIVVSGLNGCSSDSQWLLVRSAQDATCTSDRYAAYVGMSDLGITSSNPPHYSAADNITVGTRLANAMITAINYGDPLPDTTPPTPVLPSSPQAISSDSYTATGTATDDTAVSGCKYRIGSEPDATHGTACTGTTSWSCSTSGYSSGSNTLYVECYDAVPNYSTGHSITVNYTTPTPAANLGCKMVGGKTIN